MSVSPLLGLVYLISELLLTYSTSSRQAPTRRSRSFLQVECRIATLLQIFETHSLPALARCFPRSFAFYVAHPVRSIRRRYACLYSLLSSCIVSGLR